MSIADEKALRDLEFEKLKRIVSSYSSSPLGEEAVSYTHLTLPTICSV